MIEWGFHCREPAVISARMQVFVAICCDKVGGWVIVQTLVH